MATGEDWHRWEVALVVEAYIQMLLHQRRDEPFVKSHIEQNLVTQLEGRSKGSVSRKFMNISAAIHELGIPSVSGYKPLPNLQHIVRDVLAEQLAASTDLLTVLAQEVESEAERGRIDSLLNILEEPPEIDQRRQYAREPSSQPTTLVLGRNWLHVEQLKRTLGLRGEELVMEFEEVRLRQAGRPDLARRIEHVAATQGDGLGYDISSFETSGRERLIEVKTTRFGKFTPFFASTKEVRTSVDFAESFHLYRVFSFDKKPGMFQLPGSLWETCALDPAIYCAQPGTPRAV